VTLSVTWVLLGVGWADCHAEDDTHVSYVTEAPEDLLGAVTRLVLGSSAEHVEPAGRRR
jgi:hypothetical protein